MVEATSGKLGTTSTRTIGYVLLPLLFLKFIPIDGPLALIGLLIFPEMRS